jgi:hypothetical protein
MKQFTPLFLLLGLLAGCTTVKPGMTKDEILSRFGPPEKTLVYGHGEALIYPDRLVAIEDGQVRSVPGSSVKDRREYLLGWAEGLQRSGALTASEFVTWQQAAAALH